MRVCEMLLDQHEQLQGWSYVLHVLELVDIHNQ
jgi:hypothetical protein